MGLFGRREPLHVQLARQGGLDAPADRQLDPRPAWQEMGVHGVQRAREWDATVTVDAPDIEGDRATFVAMPDGSLLVEDGPDTSLEPLAAAVEEVLQAPYRARAARQGDSLWAVQARQIRVLQIRNAPDGDTIDLTRDGLVVDGERAFGSVPELNALGDVVHAERLDGDLWEVKASAL